MILQFQSNKQIMEGSIFGFRKAEPSEQQPMVTPPLDMRRAQLSRQHVRALNAQFARSTLFYSTLSAFVI